MPSFSFFVLLSTIILPVIVGIAYFNKISDSVKSFFWFAVFKLCAEIVALTTAYLGINNLILLHYYTIFEILFVIILFKDKVLYAKQYLYTVAGLAIIIAFSDSYQFNSISRCLEAIYISAALITIWNESDELKIIRVAMLIYFTLGLIIFMNMKTGDPNLMLLAHCHIALGSACNILYAIGIEYASHQYTKSKITSLFN